MLYLGMLTFMNFSFFYTELEADVGHVSALHSTIAKLKKEISRLRNTVEMLSEKCEKLETQQNGDITAQGMIEFML